MPARRPTGRQTNTRMVRGPETHPHTWATSAEFGACWIACCPGSITCWASSPEFGRCSPNLAQVWQTCRLSAAQIGPDPGLVRSNLVDIARNLPMSADIRPNFDSTVRPTAPPRRPLERPTDNPPNRPITQPTARLLTAGRLPDRSKIGIPLSIAGIELRPDLCRRQESLNANSNLGHSWHIWGPTRP